MLYCGRLGTPCTHAKKECDLHLGNIYPNCKNCPHSINTTKKTKPNPKKTKTTHKQRR